jgi:hypothetical protein
MSGIDHPLAVNTNVQYLSPRCPCSGKRFAIVTGIIKNSHKISNGTYYYVIKGERKNINQHLVVDEDLLRA